MGFNDIMARRNGYSSFAEMISYAKRGKTKHQEYIDGEIAKGVYSNEQLRALAQKWCNEHAPHDGVSKTTFSFPWGSETFTVDTSKGSWIDKTLNKIGDTFNDRGSDILKGVAVGAVTGLLTGGPVGAGAGAVGGAVKGAVGGDLGNMLGGVTSNLVGNSISSKGDGMDLKGTINNALSGVGTSLKEVGTNVLTGVATGALTTGSIDGAVTGGVNSLANSFGFSGTVSGKSGTITVSTGDTSSGTSGTATTSGKFSGNWKDSYDKATDNIVASIPITYGKKGA